MSDSECGENLGRLTTGRDVEEDSRFCLQGMDKFNPDDPNDEARVVDLLDGRITEQATEVTVERACNIGGCSLTIVMSPEKGRVVTGACTADSYCLKKSFAAVDEAPTADEGSVLYGEILDTVETTFGNSVSSHCPRLTCGLSAGVSEDGVPGTDGECDAEACPAEPDQQQLDF